MNGDVMTLLTAIFLISGSAYFIINVGRYLFGKQ